MITLCIIPNLMERAGRMERKVRYRGGTINDYVKGKYRDGWRVVLGREAEAVTPERWDETPIMRGDYLILTPDIKGWEAIGIALLKIILTTAISYGVSYAISKWGGKGAKPVTGDSSVGDSQVYGWDGIRMTADVGLAIPIIYGTHKIGGNVINAYLTNETVNFTNDDGDTDQHDENYLYLLIALGEGPVWSIAGIGYDANPWASGHAYSTGERVTYANTLWRALRSTTADQPDKSASDWASEVVIGDKIEIDGNPISNYAGIDIYTRLGNETQDPVPIFGDIHNAKELSVKLLMGAASYLATENSDVRAVQFLFKMPSCIRANATGGYEYPKADPSVDIYYRLYDPAIAPTSGTWPGDQKQTLAIHAKSPNEIRRSLRIDNLPAGRYEFRIIKTTKDSDKTNNIDMYLSGWDEIQYDDLSYPSTALLGLKMLATNQLSGSVSNVVTEVCGRQIETYTAKSLDASGPRLAKASNPIWCLRDLLLNPRYGLGNYFSASMLDVDLFQSEADYCDALVTVDDVTEKRFELNLVMDSGQGALDWINQICQIFRACLLIADGLLKPVIEKPSTFLYPFGMGNIKSGSFQASFLTSLKRPNIIEIQFLDAANNYQRDTISAEDDDSIDTGGVVRKQTLFMPGITSATQAVRLARYLINAAKFCTRSIAFVAAVEAVSCMPQDLIAFAHDVPQWGLYSGRVNAAGSATVTLDQDIVIPSGKTYKIRVKTSNDTVQEKTITSAAGSYAAGAALSINTALSPAAAAYDVYQIGEANLIYKPYRITEMKRRGDCEVEVKAVEYNESIYDDAGKGVPGPQYSGLPDPRKPPALVGSLKAATGFSYYTQVTLSWTKPVASLTYGLWDHCDIYMSQDAGKSYQFYARSLATSLDMSSLVVGRTYYFKVQSVSPIGVKSAFTSAVTVTASAPRPANVTGLELRGQGNDATFRGRDAVFDWRKVSSQTAIYPAGHDPYGAGSGTVDPYIVGYQVEIWESGRRKRVEQVSTTAYTYTLENNWSDMGTPKRLFVIRVYAKDKYNQLSVTPCDLTVRNYQATIGAPSLTAVVYYDDSGVQNSTHKLFTRMISWPRCSDLDVLEYKVKLVYYIPGQAHNEELIYHGANTSYSESGQYLLTGMAHEYWVTVNDVYGSDGETWIQAQ